MKSTKKGIQDQWRDRTDVDRSVLEEEIEIFGMNSFKDVDGGEKKDYRASLLNDEEIHDAEHEEALKQ